MMSQKLNHRQAWQAYKDRTLIKPEWVRGVKILVENGSLRERIKKAQEGDEKVVKVVEDLKRAEVKSLRDGEQSIEEGVVMKKEHIYVPEGELKGEIVCLYYNTLVGGHGRRQKITELVTRNYWWPGVMKEVGRYVDGYNAC